MDQAAWLAQFTARGVAQMDAERARIVAKLDGEAMWRPLPGFFGRPTRMADHGNARSEGLVVVLESGRELDPHATGFSPVSARRLATSASMHGWGVRAVSSLAADPRKGLIEVVTVRFARHDERGFAAWWNGRFDCAQYLRRGQFVERLGMRRSTKVRTVLDAIEGIQLTRQDAA